MKGLGATGRVHCIATPRAMAGAGIQPEISGPGEPAADFRIDGPDAHGIPGLVNLMGIESPGLTAALSIADYVRKLLDLGSR